MPRRTLKLCEAIYNKGSDQRFIVNVGLETLFDQRPVVDFAQDFAADAVSQNLETQWLIAGRLVIRKSGRIDQNQCVDSIRMPHREFPRRAASHGITCDREFRQLQLRREGIDKVGQGIGVETAALGSARQSMAGKIQADNVK